MKQAPIIFNHPIEHLNQFLKENNRQVIFLVDTNTLTHCLPLLMELSPEISQTSFLEIPVGEKAKQIEYVAEVWSGLLELNADRSAILINLGGGVVTDFGGFVASTYKRGIRFINIPTTLLAMADASVGGKTGIDFQGLKNQIGTFSQPEMVIIEPKFLNTLPKNELTSGFAEMLKHGLIRDKKHWQDLISIDNLSPESVSPYIQRSVEIKKEVVEQDPKEKGLRKILNAGHTLGHAIETFYLINQKEQKDNIDKYLNQLINGEENLLHGEAVALGLILESFISCQLNMINQKELKEITDSILKFFPKKNLPDYQEIKNYLLHDKKNEDGKVQFILLKEIGVCSEKPIIVEEILIKEALDYYKNYKII